MIHIPVARPMLGEEEVEAVSAVLRSGLIANGPVVQEFEKRFAEFCNVKYAVATSNGTTALHAALACSDIGPGDEVIVPSFSFIASATSISMCGAKPVFADVSQETFTLSPDSVQNLLTDKTKAILGVHLYGQPCDIKELQEICDDHDLVFIEDAAQAHGSTYQDKPVGCFGNAGCFSFYPTKNMTTGEGGMITTDDPDLAKKLRIFINHGQSEKYLHTSLGYNYRMTDISGAIGCVQMTKISKNNTKRNENANILSSLLKRTGLILPKVKTDRSHVYHQYVVRVPNSFPLERKSLMTHLEQKGIGSAIHYPLPIHHQPVYKKEYGDISCPVSEVLSKEVLSLPIHPMLIKDDLLAIGHAMKEVA